MMVVCDFNVEDDDCKGSIEKEIEIEERMRHLMIKRNERREKSL